MPHGSGGSFGGGGGGFSSGGSFSFGGGGSGYSSTFEHGRTSGGSFGQGGSSGGGSHHDYHGRWGPEYYTSGPFFVNSVQRPLRDRKTEALAQNKACTVFLLLASIIGTLWLVFKPYGSTTMDLDVNTSRLLTANSFFARNMKLTTKGEFQGPILHSFKTKPDLDSEVRWSDYQNFTLNYWHQEFYYYLNRGSTVRMKLNVKIPERNVVYFKVIRGLDDLDAFLERPDEASIRLRDYLEYQFQASADYDYMFAFANIHHVDAEVSFELDIHSRKYDVRHAYERCDLKAHCELQLSLFGSRYGVIETPGVGETQVDNWEIELGYGIRWWPLIAIYCWILVCFMVRRSQIFMTNFDIQDTNSERAPLVTSIEEGSTTPTEPTMAVSVPEEEYASRTDKEVSEDHLCSVCLDAAKDSFLVPCGHRATCFACGLRISKSDQATCPICRQQIGEVKKIFDA